MAVVKVRASGRSSIGRADAAAEPVGGQQGGQDRAADDAFLLCRADGADCPGGGEFWPRAASIVVVKKLPMRYRRGRLRRGLSGDGPGGRAAAAGAAA